MGGESKDELIRQISGAWDRAQAQLQELRHAVERTEQLASLKSQSGALLRERDKAFRDLGEGVAQAVKAGRVQLPKELEMVLGAVEKVEQRRITLSTVIADILQEGEAAAGRKLEKKPASARPATVAKPLAPKLKTR
jgi:hypothetical protein